MADGSAPILPRTDPMEIECRRCGAAPGTACRTPAGYFTKPHGVRRGRRGCQSSPRRQHLESKDRARKWRERYRAEKERADRAEQKAVALAMLVDDLRKEVIATEKRYR